MILTCPACGTQYVVKDGAIPAQGRQVRCASCKHSWHQDPGEAPEPAPAAPEAQDEPISDAAPSRGADIDAAIGPESAATTAGFTPVEPVAPPADALVEAPVAAVSPPEPDPGTSFDHYGQANEPVDDHFSPFARSYEEEPRRRSPLVTVLLVVLALAALAAAFWFLAPPEWKARVGIAGSADTPLQLMMTHSDRQKLASGNELLAVTGRVINPTDESQRVPPIQAQLRSSSGQVVHSWTIPPPARTLPPGASATFNSAEVNVPSGGDELTISLGARA